MDERKKATVSTVAVLDLSSGALVPIQVTVVVEEDGKERGVFSSLVKVPAGALSSAESAGLSRECAEFAPKLSEVLQKVSEMTSGCEVLEELKCSGWSGSGTDLIKMAVLAM